MYVCMYSFLCPVLTPAGTLYNLSFFTVQKRTHLFVERAALLWLFVL